MKHILSFIIIRQTPSTGALSLFSHPVSCPLCAVLFLTQAQLWSKATEQVQHAKIPPQEAGDQGDKSTHCSHIKEAEE